MDGLHFDRLTVALATGPSRRRLLAALLGSVLAGRVGRRKIKAKKKKKKQKKCSLGRPSCGGKCCVLDETCQKGKCKHHCEDGVKNLGETDVDCGGVCDGVLGFSPFGRCDNRKRCVDDRDCHSVFCEELESGAGKVCVDCNIDSDCALFAAGRPRCLDHFCFECFLNSDCPGQFNPPEERFCISLPVAAGQNNEPCPNNQPCVCRECRNDGDCPVERPHCQDDGRCFECLEDTHCPQGSLCSDEGNCEVFVCHSDDDCAGLRCCEGECFDGECEEPR